MTKYKMGQESNNNSATNAIGQLMVFPLSEQRLDFYSLNGLGIDIAQQLLDSILKEESFELCINVSSNKIESADKKLMFDQIQSALIDFSISGTALKLGYPILVLDDSALGKDISAPVFYWELDFRNSDDDNQQHWNVTYDANSFVFNDVLKNYLIARYDLDFEEIFDGKSELNGKNLQKALSKLAAAINIKNPETVKLLPVPSKEQLNAAKNSIIWSAVLGKTEVDLALPLNIHPKNRRSWFTGVGSLSLNSMQESAINELFDGNDVLLYGPENSGKTRTAAAFLPSLMSDGGSCLYLCSNATTQLSLKAMLENLGLSESGVWFVDQESSAVESLLYQISKLPERIKKLPKFEEKSYYLKLQEFLTLREKLSARYDAIQKPMLDGTDWTNMVGRFLKNHRKDGKQYLSRLLDTADYKWTLEEYRQLRSEILENKKRFTVIQSLQHPLSLIQDYIFEEMEEDMACDWVKENVLTYNKLLRDLYKKYTSFIDAYADDLRFHYEGHIKELKSRIENIRRDVKVYQSVYGNSFDFSDGFTKTRLRILSVFSKQSGQILGAKEEIFNSYEALKTMYLEKKYFEYNLPPFSKYLNLSDIGKDLEAFEQAADAWLIRIPKIVKQKIKDLTFKLPLRPDLKQRFEQLETQLEDFFLNLDQKKIFKTVEKPKSQKAVDRETQLRKLLEHFTAVESQLKIFKEFYRWRTHWLNMGENCRKLITALVSVRPQSWETAYDSWYLYHYLDKNYSLHLPETDFPLQTYMQLQAQLRELVPVNALINVREHQSERLTELKKEQNFNPTKISSKYQDVKLKSLVEQLGIDFISELFPLIVIKPALADKIFDHKVALFDTVIMDDAHLIDSKLGRKLSKLGAQRLVLGRKDFGDNYLLSMLESGFAKIYRLDISYSKDSIILEDNRKLNKSTLKKELRDELCAYLSDYINADRIQKAVRVNDEIEADIVITPISGSKKIAIILDGWLKQVSKYDVDAAVHRSESMKNAGFDIYPIWSIHWWRNPEASVEKLVAYILQNDKA
jgi:hypothetical protein